MKLARKPNAKKQVADQVGLFESAQANPHTRLLRGRAFASVGDFSRALLWYHSRGIRIAAVDVSTSPAGYLFELDL